MEYRDLIARLIRSFDCRSYLEVGVAEGRTFFHQTCRRKVAVDPKFRFDLVEARRREAESRFYEETSDAFFASHAGENGPFDLIFLDGLHTAEQIIRDFLNAILHLSPRGIIVIDDVWPNSYASSLPNKEESFALKARLDTVDPRWMGNVFKVVPFIAAFCQGFSCASATEARNCLVVWRQARPSEALRPRTLGELADFAFERTRLEEELYNPVPCEALIARIAAALGSSPGGRRPVRV